jgi:hypothetical protein
LEIKKKVEGIEVKLRDNDSDKPRRRGADEEEKTKAKGPDLFGRLTKEL